MAGSWAKTNNVQRDGDPFCADLAGLLANPNLRSMENPENREHAEYEIFSVSWRGVDLEIRHCPCWLSMPDDEFVTQHLEIRSTSKRILPITETGYRSHFINGANALAEFNNDPVEFVLWWLDEAAKASSWTQREEDDRQGSLF